MSNTINHIIDKTGVTDDVFLSDPAEEDIWTHSQLWTTIIF